MSSVQILVIGLLPPPVQGMTAITQAVLTQLQLKTAVQVVNLSPSRTAHPLLLKGYKVLKIFTAAWQIIRLKWQGPTKIYMPSDAGKGMYLTLLLILISRLGRCPVYLHHHSWAYLARYDWRMHLINRLMASQGTHIVLCPHMQATFNQLYPERTRFLQLSNAAFFTEETLPMQNAEPDCIRVGHLSNLTVEKGLMQVIDTVRLALSKDIPVRLILAGKAVSQQEEKMIETAKRTLGHLLDYRGAVYGLDKSKFYQDIDVFLFPTQYRNEAQPLVIFEALKAGVPTIAYHRGCIGSMVQDSGLAVSEQTDFVTVAVQQLEKWFQTQRALQKAAKNASLQMALMSQAAQADLTHFLSQLLQ